MARSANWWRGRAAAVDRKGPKYSSTGAVGARRLCALLLAVAGALVFVPARAGGSADESECAQKCK